MNIGILALVISLICGAIYAYGLQKPQEKPRREVKEFDYSVFIPQDISTDHSEIFVQ